MSDGGVIKGPVRDRWLTVAVAGGLAQSVAEGANQALNASLQSRASFRGVGVTLLFGLGFVRSRKKK